MAATWPAQAFWRATGVKDGDFDKPIVAVANCFTQFVPGHVRRTGNAHGQGSSTLVLPQPFGPASTAMSREARVGARSRSRSSRSSARGFSMFLWF